MSRFACTTALAAVFTLAASAASAQVPPEIRARAEQVKACLDQRAAAGKFQGVFMVGHAGAPVTSGAYGPADPQSGRQNTVATSFDVGSMPKMFTAVAVAQLVEAGKLRFTDTVGQHLDGLPPDVAKLTLHQLLTHTSGLGNYFTPENTPVISSAKTAADLVRIAAATGVSFEPGSRLQYSNAGFVLAGAVVEKVSGQPFRDYIRARILQPAGLTETSLEGPGAASAVGTARRGPDGQLDAKGELIAVKGPLTGVYSPAGGAFTTAADLTRFAHAVAGGKLVSRAMLEQLWAPRITPPGPPPRPGRSAAYGYGFGVRKIGDVRLVGHNGGLPGFGAELMFAPEAGWSTAVLSNSGGPSALFVSAAAQDIMAGQPPREGVCRGEDPPMPTGPAGPPPDVRVQPRPVVS